MNGKRIISSSADETASLAAKIGRKLKGGEVIELVSDLGGGKTTFVRGLAHGLGSQDMVRSPSFTLSNKYRTKSLTLYHFDFYRLTKPGIMRDELAEVLVDPDAVVAIEWGAAVNDILPKERLTIVFKVTGPDKRELILSYPKRLEHLVKNT